MDGKVKLREVKQLPPSHTAHRVETLTEELNPDFSGAEASVTSM